MRVEENNVGMQKETAPRKLLPSIYRTLLFRQLLPTPTEL